LEYISKNLGSRNLTYFTLCVPSLHNNHVGSFILPLLFFSNGSLLSLDTLFVLMEHLKETQGRQVWGGVLFGPKGIRVFDYYWNLGMETNNKVEAYALLQGIQLEKKRKIQNLNVVGDSKTLIRIMILGSSPHNMSLKILIDRICLLVGSMHIKYFHVL
jgi:hypothetical protein